LAPHHSGSGDQSLIILAIFTAICNAKSVRKLLTLCILLSFLLLGFLFFAPNSNISFAQSNGDLCDPNNPVCDTDLVCRDPYGEGTRFECRPPEISFGETCNTSQGTCAGNMTCIPDAPGSDTGKCDTAKEGSICRIGFADACGPFNVVPLRCREDSAGTPKCQRVPCDPALGDAQCKAVNPSFFCIRESSGAFCGLENFVNRVINVRINYKEKRKVKSPIELGPYSVDLKLEGNIIKTLTTQKRVITPEPGKEDETWDLEVPFSLKFEDIGPGLYEVCVPALSQCKEVTKESGKPGEPDPVVFEAKKGLIPAPPPPCADEDGALINNQCRKFQTGVGILSTRAGEFISSVFRILLAGAGAIALLLIIRAGYKIMTSEGNQEKVKEGRDQLVAAIVGLMFLIFSLVFLQVIGVDLLRIPGFFGSASSPRTPGNNADPLDLPGITPNPQAGCTERILRPGDSGQCVEGLQRILGVNPIDGSYNTDTENAVIRLQREKNIHVDGVVGPCTWGAIMQEPIDPICSEPLTPENVRRFQTEKGLIVDGRINKCTYDALMGLPIPDSCKKK
jgi:peptidoglycan hydrolase-like protein with peptidoglycan-binding domain